MTETSNLTLNSQSIHWEKLDRPWQNRIKSSLKSSKMPQCLIYPENEASLAEIIQLAHQENLKILPCGNGTKLNWGGLVSQADLVISTQKLNSIIEQAIGDLTITVEAGVTLQQIQNSLRPYKQFLPIDPSYPENATIGGIIATADTGSLRQRYGGMRDLILGLSFVRADGNIAKAGGRVVKNVAGYDLMKLFTGSYGTLGVISQVTMRSYPIPPSSATLILTGQAENIKQTRSLIVNSSLTPTCADIISPSLAQKLNLEPNLGLILRFQSIPESVEKQTNITKEIAQQLNLNIVQFEEEKEQQIWHQIQNFDQLIICKIGILPGEIVTLLKNISDIALININSGVGKCYLENPDAIPEMRKICEQNQGFLTILSAPLEIKINLKNWGYTGNALNLMAQIKQQFDPQNILSCDRYF